MRLNAHRALLHTISRNDRSFDLVLTDDAPSQLGTSLFDGKFVRILIEKLSDIVDLAEKFFPLGLVESHREPSEAAQTYAALFADL